MTTTDTLLALLEESEVTPDDELGLVLAGLQALGAGPVPAPSPELAALLVNDGRRRSRLHRRGAVVGALVVLSLGTGVTAAAASPDVREGAAGVIAAAVHVLRPPSVAEHPAPARAHTPAGVPASRIPLSSTTASSTPTRGTVPSDVPSRSSEPGEDRHAAGDSRGGGRGAGASDGRGSSGSSGSHDAAGSGSGSGSGSHDGTASGPGASSGSGRGTGHESTGDSTGDSLQSGTGSVGDDGGGSHRGSGGDSGDDR